MTDTTQPDPRVEPDGDPRRGALRCIECEFRADDSPGGWYDATEHRNVTGHRYEHVKPARTPLMAADIPAGQGPASLHLYQRNGVTALRYRNEHGHSVLVDSTARPRSAGPAEAVAALWEHLAATLPTVTDEEEA